MAELQINGIEIVHNKDIKYYIECKEYLNDFYKEVVMLGITGVPLYYKNGVVYVSTDMNEFEDFYEDDFELKSGCIFVFNNDNRVVSVFENKERLFEAYIALKR